jgi:hypothetical protein
MPRCDLPEHPAGAGWGAGRGARSVRCAITVAGILGNSTNNARTSASTPSTSRGCAARSYFGGRSEANAARTVFREIPSCRATSLIDTPSARCSRRISAQSSTLITLQDRQGWSVFIRRHLLSFQASSTGPGQRSRFTAAGAHPGRNLRHDRALARPTGHASGPRLRLGQDSDLLGLGICWRSSATRPTSPPGACRRRSRPASGGRWNGCTRG